MDDLNLDDIFMFEQRCIERGEEIAMYEQDFSEENAEYFLKGEKLGKEIGKKLGETYGFFDHLIRNKENILDEIDIIKLKKNEKSILILLNKINKFIGKEKNDKKKFEEIEELSKRLYFNFKVNKNKKEQIDILDW